MKKLRVIFFGTPDFAIPTLDMINHHPSISIVAIVTMPDRPAGRGQHPQPPEVATYAKQHGIPLVQTQNINTEEEVLLSWKNEGIDLMVVLAFAQFLGERLLNLPTYGCFNIHTSLLPKYRGAAPIQYALWSGDSQTGVSIQKMVKKMDAGDIVHECSVSIAPAETGGQLTTRLKYYAALACNEFLDMLIQGKITSRPQDESAVSFAPTLKKEDGFINFSAQTLVQIQNRIRAMDPWPGSYCFINGKRLKILSVEASPIAVPPGKISNAQGMLVIGCLDGSLRLLEIQLEGKKRCSDTKLLHGWRGDMSLTPAQGPT